MDYAKESLYILNTLEAAGIDTQATLDDILANLPYWGDIRSAAVLADAQAVNPHQLLADLDRCHSKHMAECNRNIHGLSLLGG
jgi:hypothetical protein